MDFNKLTTCYVKRKWIQSIGQVLRIIIVITSHRLIARCGQQQLLLGATCNRFLSPFSFARRAVSAWLPSNVLTDAQYERIIREILAMSDLSKVSPWTRILRCLNTVSCKRRTTLPLHHGGL